MDLRKTAEAFFDFLEENNVTDFSQLPPEQLKLWLILKDGQRLNLYAEIMKKEKKQAKVIPFRRGTSKRVCS